VDRAEAVVVDVAPVAALEPEQVRELPQRVRRLQVAQLQHRARLLLAAVVDVAPVVADVVVVALLPNQLHDLQMEL
jgi:hypothetical protein